MSGCDCDDDNGTKQGVMAWLGLRACLSHLDALLHLRESDLIS